ncbi:MAG: SGNH/GDSL hydrolase family protein [Cyanobacteria bacterium P01_H01_bin.119]
MLLKTRLIALSAVLAPLAVPASVSAATFSEIYVFGDSLSDTGNLYRQTSLLPPPFNFFGIPASPPYAQQFANGPLWVEYLADDLQPGADVLPIRNFAVGGATTSTFNIVNNFLPLPDFDGLQEQVTDNYLGLNPIIDPNALYTLWAGANDYLGGGVVDPTIPVGNLQAAIDAFIDAGVQNLLVLNLPDLGRVPQALSSNQSAALSALSSQHNALLDQVVAGLEAVTLFDVNALFDQALSGAFGFTNTTESCLQGFQSPLPFQTGLPCANPDQHVFWDDLHPTTQVHAILGSAVATALQDDSRPDRPVIVDPTTPTASTPEPGLMAGLAGLGAIAAYLKSNRRFALKFVFSRQRTLGGQTVR